MLVESPLKNVRLIDATYCGYKNISAIFVLRSPKTKETALFDVGTPNPYSKILNDLKDLGIQKSELTSIFITHSHMDHSGNCSLFIKDFPHIKIYGSNETMKRISNPEKIIKHMSTVMGKRYDMEFGDNVRNIPEKYLNTLKDGECKSFGDFTDIKFIYTPGHVSDHVSFYSISDSIIFTGDTFGNMYSDITRPVYSCPYMFDVVEARKTIDKIVNSGAEWAGVSHYGFTNKLKWFGEKSREWVDKMSEIAHNSKQPHVDVENHYKFHFGDDFQKHPVIRGHFHTNRMGTLSVWYHLHGKKSQKLADFNPSDFENFLM